LRPLADTQPIGKVLALPYGRAGVKLAYEKVQPSIASSSLNVPYLEVRMFLCEQLKAESLECVPIDLFQSLVQRMHAGDYRTRCARGLDWPDPREKLVKTLCAPFLA
jgi:hypothetical protein